MTDKESNSDKERREKKGVLGTDRAKQLEKTKDGDSEDNEDDDEDDAEDDDDAKE